MGTTVFVNGATLTDSDWFNDLNRLHYTILGDPANAAAIASPLSTISPIASAATPDIFAVTVGQIVDYTGANTATGFVAAPQAGAQRTLVCAGAAVFTAGANMLIDGVASGSDFTAAAGDTVVVIAVTTTQFRLKPSLASGLPIFKIGSFTRDVTTATGTQAVTGTGFKPRAVFFISGPSTEGNTGSVGFDTQGAGGSLANASSSSAGRMIQSNTISIQHYEAAATTYKGTIQSMDADGFTVSWTKAGLPTGTLVISYLAVR